MLELTQRHSTNSNSRSRSSNNNSTNAMYSSVASADHPDEEDDDPISEGDIERDIQRGGAHRCYYSNASNNANNAYVPMALVAVSLLLALGAYRSRQEIFPASWWSTCSVATVDGQTTTRENNHNYHNKYSITYDPSVYNQDWNPFQWDLPQEVAWMSPLISDSSDIQDKNNDNDYYAMQPQLMNDTLVFVSNGDVYWARLTRSDDDGDTTAAITAALRVTQTVGNVRTPLVHPDNPYSIFYTATYANRREIYALNVMGLSNQGSIATAQRLTYTDSAYGISSLVGVIGAATGNNHNNKQHRLRYSARNTQVGLRDVRLYDLVLEQQSSSNKSNNSQPSPTVLEQVPIPLAQAVDGVTFFPNSNEDNNDDDEECIIFVRYQQSSWTVRYVGGTVEQLWLYCSHHDQAVPLTSDYHGTCKHPQIVSSYGDNTRYLLFLSDFSRNANVGPEVFQSGKENRYRATTMNLFAVPLPPVEQMYQPKFNLLQDAATVVPLTQASCQFNGMAIREYTVDVVTGRVLFRIGASLYQLSASQIRKILSSSSSSTTSPVPKPAPLPVTLFTDGYEQQERLIDVQDLTISHHKVTVDAWETHFDTTAALVTVRGQAWVLPVLDDTTNTVPFQGAGQNLPPRRYRVVPGAMTGGAIRVLASRHVPLYYVEDSDADDNSKQQQQRLALILATDPVTDTAEHAFYLIEAQTSAVNAFVSPLHWPQPIVGGHVNGGPTSSGGLGSVNADSVQVSPCGRRFAWTDTDDRICVAALPLYGNASTTTPLSYQCLPTLNDQGEPLAGTIATLSWSPGGRYLGVEHSALNQFGVISIVDCGSPEPPPGPEDNTTAAAAVAEIQIGRITQMTPSRFNSYSLVWGRSTFDIYWHSIMVELCMELGLSEPPVVSTTLYFASDRDVVSDVHSPWGSRAPLPHFQSLEGHVYALPLPAKPSSQQNDNIQDDDNGSIDASMGRFAGGGVMEIFADSLDLYKEKFKSASSSSSATTKDEGARRRQLLKEQFRARLVRRLQRRQLRDEDHYLVTRYLEIVADDNPASVNQTETASPFPQDADLDLPDSSNNNLSIARRAYRMAHIPRGTYAIVAQTKDDGSLVIVDLEDESLKLFSAGVFPSDSLEVTSASGIERITVSTSRHHLIAISNDGGKLSVVSNTAAGIAGLLGDHIWSSNQADTKGLAVSVWPALEYRQMYGDAWRMLRDYFYDPNLHNVNWNDVHARYLPLVQFCGKREELDDVLGQMGSELSALHLFVYGGEYNSPDAPPLGPASLGVSLKRSPEWRGYTITEIPQRDPDFNMMDMVARYCPLSDQALRPSGQKGLKVGDVIVAVNGESVMQGPDINFHLRGQAGRSVRLDVLRFQSCPGLDTNNGTVAPVPLLVVPITPEAADSLRYDAWEWKTGQMAKKLARGNNFTLGYIHMRAMDREGEDAFARGFFPDYDKDALIIDVRHNLGGNIDSWVLTFLQRKAWMYWGGRGFAQPGDLDYDEQFAFRGKVVVLIDEHTSSNGEGVARGISELGLGKLIGTRTWGGGIWGSSANHLVDGGIAAAPQWGTYNENFTWGGGVETTGVSPHIEVDNNPRTAFDGKDEQLERAIAELRTWLKKEPVPPFPVPGKRPDMSLYTDDCPI